MYTATTFAGTPTETDEANPIWFLLSGIPYDRMWPDDQFWIPWMLREDPFDARFLLDQERILDQKILPLALS